MRAGEYEAIYANMPPFGLGKVGTLAPLTGTTSRERITEKAAANRG